MKCLAKRGIDPGRETHHPNSRQQWTAEEFGTSSWMSGAEGATAPETLRQMDRNPMTLWKVAGRMIVLAHRR